MHVNNLHVKFKGCDTTSVWDFMSKNAVHACRKGLMGLGVADGVYQWREQGIDAGEFSRLLMHTALDTIEAGQPDVLKGDTCHMCH